MHWSIITKCMIFHTLFSNFVDDCLSGNVVLSDNSKLGENIRYLQSQEFIKGKYETEVKFLGAYVQELLRKLKRNISWMKK